MDASLELQPRVIEKALKEAMDRKYERVFLTVGSPKDLDHLHSRVKRYSAAVLEIKAVVQELASVVCDEWKADVFSFMRLHPGGSMQALHKNYTSTETTQGTIPGSATIALEDKTALRVFQGFCDDLGRRTEKIVEISPVYCLIFRGGLIHIDVGFQQLNHRLHCNVTVDDPRWEADVVQSARAAGYFCSHCGDLEDEDTEKVHQQCFTCERNTAYVKNKEERRNHVQGIYLCGFCKNKIYKSAGGL